MASSPLCGKTNEELNHLLVHCPLVWGLWEGFLSPSRSTLGLPLYLMIFFGLVYVPYQEEDKKVMEGGAAVSFRQYRRKGTK